VSKDIGLTSIADICVCFDLKRDAIFSYSKEDRQRHMFRDQVIKIVKGRRKSLPREGMRKLMKSLDMEFENANMKVGRNTLFNILKEHIILTLRNLIL